MEEIRREWAQPMRHDRVAPFDKAYLYLRGGEPPADRRPAAHTSMRSPAPVVAAAGVGGGSSIGLGGGSGRGIGIGGGGSVIGGGRVGSGGGTGGVPGGGCGVGPCASIFSKHNLRQDDPRRRRQEAAPAGSPNRLYQWTDGIPAVSAGAAVTFLGYDRRFYRIPLTFPPALNFKGEAAGDISCANRS
jgi:hypothetical protein